MMVVIVVAQTGGITIEMGERNLTLLVIKVKLEAYFDNKLHPDLVPEWDGNPDTLAQWILKVNHLAQPSNYSL